jgi:antitoxin component of MazEF toxin-antitoxin module
MAIQKGQESSRRSKRTVTQKYPTLKDLVRKITRENRRSEIRVGAERGKEKVVW